jgi:ectoine hydroxylase-related dioxygenase (phytanoyl-CoA dioxygenase family)
LGAKNNELSIAECMIRIDVPRDKENIAGWHQEISYLRNNGLVIWIPLSDITPDLGPLQVCPKSHHEGELAVAQNKNLPSNVSTVSVDEIKPEYIAKYSIMDVEIKKGDVLFFNTELFHRSGVNTSKRIRFSCQIRHAINTAEDFVPFRVTKTYNKFGLEQVAQKHPAFSNNFNPTH